MSVSGQFTTMRQRRKSAERDVRRAMFAGGFETGAVKQS
jgi:hypothetical protein